MTNKELIDYCSSMGSYCDCEKYGCKHEAECKAYQQKCGTIPFGEHVFNSDRYTDEEIVMSEERTEPKILDSGERREFESGAVRDIRTGKGRCDLLPLMQVAELLASMTAPDVIISDLAQYQGTKNVVYLFDAIKAFSAKLGWSTETAMLEVSKHFEAGCQKYGERNWEKGIPEHCYIDSAIRHYLKWRDGMTDEPHDRAVLWNLICLWWTHENITRKGR